LPHGNEEFYIVSLSEMLVFGVLLVFAYRAPAPR
jgi:hypothetical protein